MTVKRELETDSGSADITKKAKEEETVPKPPTTLRGEEGAALEVVGLKAVEGNRVEVLWEIQMEEDEAIEIWWAGTLNVAEGEQEGRRTGDGRVIFAVQFDARADLGFEDTKTHKVAFEDEQLLLDIESGETMPWRPEGQEAYTREVLKLTAAGKEEIAIEEVAAILQEDPEGEAEGTRLLQEMPMTQQLVLAQHFRQMADAVKAKLREVSSKGHSVTKEDISSVFNSIAKTNGGGTELLGL